MPSASYMFSESVKKSARCTGVDGLRTSFMPSAAAARASPSSSRALYACARTEWSQAISCGDAFAAMASAIITCVVATALFGSATASACNRRIAGSGLSMQFACASPHAVNNTMDRNRRAYTPARSEPSMAGTLLGNGQSRVERRRAFAARRAECHIAGDILFNCVTCIHTQRGATRESPPLPAPSAGSADASRPSGGLEYRVRQQELDGVGARLVDGLIRKRGQQLLAALARTGLELRMREDVEVVALDTAHHA